ncbi:MAG: hypothetical protein CVV63_02980, partial [Tenericutes bacterium HGW-Tenericutes-8]
KDNLFVVIDGATGLHEKSTNISLASQMVNDMQTFLETSPIDDFEQCLLDLARNLQEKYQYSGEKSMIPSASLAALHIKNNMVYMNQLGDCSISYQTKNIHRFTDQRLIKLDHIGKKMLLELQRYNDFESALSQVKPTLIKHRNLMNETNGYMAFQPSLMPKFEIKSKRIRLKDLKSFLIYSDGYYSARDTFKLYKNHEMFYCSKIEQTIQSIIDAAYQANSLIQYPRFKIIDDISVIKVDL